MSKKQHEQTRTRSLGYDGEEGEAREKKKADLEEGASQIHGGQLARLVNRRNTGVLGSLCVFVDVNPQDEVTPCL